MATMSDGTTYTDFASCVLEGSRASSEVIVTLTPEEINKNQLYVQFACVKKPDIEL
mgnify:FL=1